jgi:hypothetical protein
MRVDGKNSGCYKSAVYIHSWLTRAFASLICFVHLLRRSSLTAADLGFLGLSPVMLWVWCGFGVGLVWVWCGFGLGMVWVSNEVPSWGGGTPGATPPPR